MARMRVRPMSEFGGKAEKSNFSRARRQRHRRQWSKRSQLRSGRRQTIERKATSPMPPPIRTLPVAASRLRSESE